MKNKSTSKFRVLNLRVLGGLLLVLGVMCLTLLGLGVFSKTFAQPKPQQDESNAIHENPAARMAWERLRLQDEHGKISPNMLQRAYEQKKTMPFRSEAWAEFLPKNSTGQPDVVQTIWTSIGPGNIGGRTRSIIIHPTSSDTMWLGAVGGGVWKTTNLSSPIPTWAPTTDFLANLAINCMVIDPTNSNVLYAGTGEPYQFDGIRGAGIFKTGNGGSTWTQLSSTANNPDFYDVTRIAAAPYPALRGTVLLAATTTGLFRSFDGGSRWLRIMSGRYNTVAFDPNDPTKAVASSGLTSLDSIAVFRSTDAGSTWGQSTITGGPSLTGRIELAYAASNSNIVYASADSPGGPNGTDEGALFKSTDGGQSFSWTGVKGTLYLYGWYANTLWVDPTNPYVLAVGCVDLFRCTSTDGGATFNKVQIGGQGRSDYVDHHVVTHPPNYNGSTNKTVFNGNDAGPYKTNDISGSPPAWTSLSHGLDITQFYGGAANSDGSTIIGGTQDRGTVRYQSQIGSEGWDTTLGGDGGACAAGGGYFYGEAATYGLSYLWRSPDASSANVQYINPTSTNCTNCSSCNADPDFNHVTPLVLDPSNPSTLLAGTNRLWRSQNANTPIRQDVRWTIIKCPQPGDDNISAIAVAPGNSNIIWIGLNSGALYFTTNGTAANPTWTKINAPSLPQRYVESIAFAGWDPRLWNNVYVAFGGGAYGQGFSPDNLWRTTNGGSTWTNISNGLPSVPVRSVVTSQSAFNHGYLYIGTAVGVFASTDNGGTWSPGFAGDAPANVWVDQLFWTNNGGKLIAVTHGRGMFTANAQ